MKKYRPSPPPNIFPMACARNLPTLLRNLELSHSVMLQHVMVSHSTRGEKKRRAPSTHGGWLHDWDRVLWSFLLGHLWLAWLGSSLVYPIFVPVAVYPNLLHSSAFYAPGLGLSAPSLERRTWGTRVLLQSWYKPTFSSFCKWIPEISLGKGEDKGGGGRKERRERRKRRRKRKRLTRSEPNNNNNKKY